MVQKIILLKLFFIPTIIVLGTKCLYGATWIMLYSVYLLICVKCDSGIWAQTSRGDYLVPTINIIVCEGFYLTHWDTEC